jgi:hypothetical protein|tara:strand:- start:98 stop:316 length:219 start_codon:yes stop_codon:yes gene_type:complete
LFVGNGIAIYSAKTKVKMLGLISMVSISRIAGRSNVRRMVVNVLSGFSKFSPWQRELSLILKTVGRAWKQEV